MALRPYQQEAIDELRAAFRRGHRRVLFQLPTGGGKTHVFSYITSQAVGRGRRVLVLVHRNELLEQASGKLAGMGVEHGVIAAGCRKLSGHAVQVASIQTIARRLGQIPTDWFDLVVVDEAHHATAATWDRVIRHFEAARVLGVTATPCRTDGRGLGDLFDDLVLGPTGQWLTDQGFLARARVFCPPGGVDVGSLHKRAGDYDMAEATEAFKVVGDAVEHYRRWLDGQTAIMFCCSVAHAEEEADALRAAGVPASSIDGKMSMDRRRELLAALGAGDIKVLSSCSLIGEGVDVPSVAGCILRRPTQSLSLHLQMIGRCLRPDGDKVAIVLDHVGNVERLGHHLEPVNWSLDGDTKVKRTSGISVRVCSRCYASMPSTASACSDCGAVFPVDQRKPTKVVDGALVEVEAGAPAPEFRHERSTASSLDDLIRVGYRRGMANPIGWARHVMAARERKRQAR